jgi:hypothetical protein
MELIICFGGMFGDDVMTGDPAFLNGDSNE